MMQQRRPLNPTERRDWLRLSRTERVGPITFRQLLRRFGSASAALEALPDLARRGGRSTPLKPPPAAQAEDEIARLERRGGRFIAWIEPEYSEALAAVEDAPPLLAVLGSPVCLRKRALGIVGARNASLNGRKMAERLAKALGPEGFTVVSGLARGIDTCAHEASLDSGTIAVLAGGVDIVYPEENKGLYQRIVDSGAIVSEQPMGCEPRAQLFPKRNRIISGLSLGVIVVEAARQSGSLITARMALEQGREVFAVPGSPLDPRAQGCNELLRQGAVLVETIQDVLAHIHTLPKTLAEDPAAYQTNPAAIAPPIEDSDLQQARQRLLEYLSPAPVAVDELVRQSHLPAQVVLTVLLEWELAGRIDRQPGNQVALVEENDI